jgi:hypothetical protein
VENIKGYPLGRLPIDTEGLLKVSDLIEFEGPILSHFTDTKSNNYVFYWVDQDQRHNRWLIWKINDYQLYGYLKRQISLKEFLLKPDKDYIFSADIDSELHYKSVYAIDLDEVNLAYVPDEDEYFSFAVPQVYERLISSFEHDQYLQLLRERALYFKWNTRGDSKRFLNTVGAADAGGLLTKISRSFLKYVEFKFYEGYKAEITDFKRLNKIVAQFKEILQPRVVDLSYSSFKVALSSDTVNQVVDSLSYKDWQSTILDRYKNDVIDVDYSSAADIAIVNELFPVEVRKEIFGPIISIINDENYQLEVVDYRRTFKRKYSRIDKANEDLILPKLKYESPQEQNTRLYTFVIEAPEGGQKSVKLSKKLLQDNTLFSQEDNKAPLLLDRFQTGKSYVELNEPIACKLTLFEKKYILESESLKIRVEDVSNEGAWAAFNKAVFDFFEQAVNEISDDTPGGLNALTNLAHIKTFHKEPSEN